MEKINLEEIWFNAIEVNDIEGKTYYDIGRTAMLEFGKQLLELAAKNALIQEKLLVNNKVVSIKKSTIIEARFIKDIEREVSVNYMSIVNTINQVK